MTDVIGYIQENEARYLEEIMDFVRIASISSDPGKKEEMNKCAEWLRKEFERIGMQKTEIISTDGHPSVYAEWLGAPGKPTILIYGHYDVQPVDPLDEWKSPPFEPTVRNGGLYGRGTVDDKGQLFVHLKAAEAYLTNGGVIPVNLKFLIEGEEEIGSPNLVPVIEENKDRLVADFLVISDSPMFAKGVPSICYGLRGLAYFEIHVRGTDSDLHSGSFGGSVINPANALVSILGKLKDENGKILIPGLYDDVLPLTEDERKMFASLPHDDEKYRESLGAPELFGESGYTTLERLWGRPSLDVNGIVSGFTGEGAKTVIPASASAKVSIRLVPNQTPDKTEELFRAYIKDIAPAAVNVEVKALHGGMPFISPPDNPLFETAREAMRKGFGAETVLVREGGSIPIVTDFSEILGIPVMLIGFGLPDENAHAPNEWIDLENFQKGIESMAYLYEGVSNG